MAPLVAVPASQFVEHMRALYQAQAYTDMLFLVGKQALPSHRWMLAAACSQAFSDLLSAVDPQGNPPAGRSTSNSSMACAMQLSQSRDTELPLCADSSPGTMETRCHGFHSDASGVEAWWNLQPRFSAFSAVGVEQDAMLDHQCHLSPSVRAVVNVSKAITPAGMQECIRYLYTGGIDITSCPISEIQDAADLIIIPDLQAYLTTLQKQEPLNPSVDTIFLDKLKSRLKQVCLDRSLYADVLFQLDDGVCSAHRPLLMARCEMMAAMFSGDFLESSAKVVHFPGVSCKCFQQLLMYLYEDTLCSQVNASNCLALIKLADQLCLPRLVALIEERVICELTEVDRHAGCKETTITGSMSKNAAEPLNGDLLSKNLQDSSEKITSESSSDASQKGSKDAVDVSEIALQLLEPCQIHNADQLADWCLYRISTTYKKVLQNHLKLLRNLHPQNQAYLNRNRWPPAWYIKEDEFYQRTMREQSNNERPAKKICFGPFSFKGSKVPKRQA